MNKQYRKSWWDGSNKLKDQIRVWEGIHLGMFPWIMYDRLSRAFGQPIIGCLEILGPIDPKYNSWIDL